MTNKEAKATFLLEYCGERCDGLENDEYDCKNCEIGIALDAFWKLEKAEKAISELKEQRFYKAAEIVERVVRDGIK